MPALLERAGSLLLLLVVLVLPLPGAPLLFVEGEVS